MKIGKIPRVFMCLLAGGLLFTGSAMAGAVASKTHSSALSNLNPEKAKAAKAGPTQDALPEKEIKVPTYADAMRGQLTEKDADKVNPFIQNMHKDRGGEYFGKNSKMGNLNGGMGKKNNNFSGSAFSPQNQDALRYFGKQNQLEKGASLANKESTMGGKSFATKSFSFNTKPGLPGFDMPPSAFFEGKESNIPGTGDVKSSGFAAKKARGYDRVTAPKPYLGPETERVQAEMATINQVFMGAAQESQDGEINFSNLPDRPLNIGEVKMLLNEGHR